jgi:hypothetical protein
MVPPAAGTSTVPPAVPAVHKIVSVLIPSNGPKFDRFPPAVPAAAAAAY